MQDTRAGEIRQDLLTKRWIIYAPERAQRPHDMMRKPGDVGELPEKDAQCPFCVGNEEMIPPVIFELPAAHNDGWRTRVVPNKYPMLHPEVDTRGGSRGLYPYASNHGHHEVLIETPFHNRDIPFMHPQEVESIIESCAQRYGVLYGSDETIETVLVFRNHGQRAGTSLRHPHSQIVAMTLVPESVAHRQQVAADYYQRNKRCLLCDMVKQEHADGSRLLAENDAFVSFVPFAAEVSCEIWIVPKQHCADFSLITRREEKQLARLLQEGLQRLYDALDDPDYNYVIRSGSRQKTFVSHLHWYLQIRPRLSTPAGFEIGSGMTVNHSLPEEDAERLRRT